MPRERGTQALVEPFGAYTLLRRLSSGGMAELFLALRRADGGAEELCVIKRILPSVRDDARYVAMLLREARIAAELSHPNVARVFEVGQIDGAHFIAMEHIDGADLDGVVGAMRRRGLAEVPLEHAIAVAIGTCAGLAHAHDKRDAEGRPLGIVHRDVSPRNVVVGFAGEVKLVDFGIARSSREPGEDTDPDLVKGKAPYMSPEQASGEEVDARSDIFSAGILLFELTTGRRLFKGASDFETLAMITRKDVPRPSELVPGYPAQLEPIVMRALARRPEDRYASAREMQEDLEAFVRARGLVVTPEGLARWMRALFEDQKESLAGSIAAAVTGALARFRRRSPRT